MLIPRLPHLPRRPVWISTWISECNMNSPFGNMLLTHTHTHTLSLSCWCWGEVAAAAEVCEVLLKSLIKIVRFLRATNRLSRNDSDHKNYIWYDSLVVTILTHQLCWWSEGVHPHLPHPTSDPEQYEVVKDEFIWIDFTWANFLLAQIISRLLRI